MQLGQSLKSVFNRKKFRQLTLAFVSATVLFGGVPSVHAQNQNMPSPPAVTQSATLPAPASSDEDLLRHNDNQPPSAALIAMTPQARMQYYMNKLCFDVNDAATDTKPGDQPVIAALNQLRGATYMGKPLIALAAQSHLKFCALQNMPAGTEAQYLPADGFVAVRRDGVTKPGGMLDLAHELLHASQDQQGLLTYYYNWDSESRLRMKLSIEAAPIALEFSVAYEKKLDGDPSYWNYLTAHGSVSAYTDPANARLFDATYKAGVKAGNTRAVALRGAAHALFEHVFNSDDWRNFYLNMEFNAYLNDVSSGALAKFPGVLHNQFTQASINNAGKVGTQPSFTQGAHVPTVASMLAKDQKMQWAFEALDLARARQSLGAEAPEVKSMEAGAILHANPYLKIDLAELTTRVNAANWSGDYKYSYSIMDTMLAEQAAPKPQPLVLPTTIIRGPAS